MDNSDKYLPCKEWIDYEMKEHQRAIRELRTMRRFLDEHTDDN